MEKEKDSTACYLYQKSSGKLQEIDKSKFTQLISKFMNIDINEVKKLENSVYKDIVKNLNFKAVGIGLYTKNINSDNYFIITINKDKETLINTLIKNNLPVKDNNSNVAELKSKFPQNYNRCKLDLKKLNITDFSIEDKNKDKSIVNYDKDNNILTAIYFKSLEDATIWLEKRKLLSKASQCLTPQIAADIVYN